MLNQFNCEHDECAVCVYLSNRHVVRLDLISKCEFDALMCVYVANNHLGLSVGLSCKYCTINILNTFR